MVIALLDDDSLPKVLFLAPYPEKKDGIGHYTHELVRSLEALGLETMVLGDLESSAADFQTDFHARKLIDACHNAVKETHADLVHIQFEEALFQAASLLAAMRALSRAGIPVVTTVHALPASSVRGPLGWVVTQRHKRAQQGVVQHSSALIVHTRDHLAELLRDGVPREKVTVVPIGARASLRAHGEPTIRSGRPRVLFTGFLTPNKGAVRLVQMAPSCRDLDFVIQGIPLRGSHPRYARNIERRARHLSNVRVLSTWLDQRGRSDLIKSAAVILLPYRRVHFQSAVLMDAVSEGIPVVTTDDGPVGTCVRENQLGIAVPEGEVDALIEATRQVLKGRERFVKNIAAYREATSLARIAEMTVHVYRVTLAGGNRAS